MKQLTNSDWLVFLIYFIIVSVYGLEVDASMFRTNRAFTAGALIAAGIVVALYTLFW
ncbi:hypothetical protein [Mucilaginibacter sp.]